MTVFGLLRHGETDWNAAGRMQGQSDDSRLTPAGEAWSRKCGEALDGLGYQRILASDLVRAVRTAEMVNAALRLPVDTDPRLREQDWGEWTGHTLKALRRDRPGAVEKQEFAAWGFRPEGGESREELLARTVAALGDAARAHPGSRILVITHQGPLRALIYRILGHGYERGKPDPVDDRAFHEIDYDGDRLTLRNLNLTLF